MATEEKDIKHIDVQEKQEMLKCALTHDELLKFGEELANAQQEAQELEDQLTNIKNDYKAKTSATKQTFFQMAKKSGFQKLLTGGAQ